MSGKAVLYFAMSLDGYIAGENGDIAWLERYQEQGEDYGFKEFMGSVDAAVMGAETAQEMLVHRERFLKVKSYVLSSKPMPGLKGSRWSFGVGPLEI